MLQGVMARSWLQPLWRGLFHVSAPGMGFSAINPQFNGELRFLRRWCAWARGRNKHPTIVDVGANEGDFSNEIMAVAQCAHSRFRTKPSNLRQTLSALQAPTTLC